MRSRAATVAALTLAACQASENRADFVEADSAGVRIVESRAPLWVEGEGWSLAEAPTLEIGAVEGAANEVLYRVTDVDRRSDGGWLVTSAATSQLLLFSDEGVFEGAIGRAGEGPGEFNGLSRAWITAEGGIAAYSFRQLTFFDAQGTFVEQFALSGGAPTDFFDDGTFLSVSQSMFREEGGAFRPPASLLRRGRDGAVLDTLVRVPGASVFVLVSDNSSSTFGTPFGANRLVAALGNSVVTMGGDSFEARVFDETGALVRVMRRSWEPVRVTDAQIAALQSRMMEGLPDRLRPSRERLFREWSYPEFVAAVDRLMVDADHNVWARAYQTDLPGRVLWSVFDPTGRWLGEVEVPAGLVVHEIGSDYLAGVWTNELDVQFVRVYELQKE
ncbi:6-bladed beta-propeller [Gemmatimonadota bacterium DH-20]|uniref:6-bladed beta-propeller n=1 Tax=Gaopeijia maritima TaxID=3119007 RepID=A0ABU9ED39_9BACT